VLLWPCAAAAGVGLHCDTTYATLTTPIRGSLSSQGF